MVIQNVILFICKKVTERLALIEAIIKGITPSLGQLVNDLGGNTMSMIREAEADEVHCKDCIWFRRYTYGYYECANESRGGRIEKYYTCEYAEKKQECE